VKLWQAAGIGVIMGCLFRVVLWAATDSLSFASFILYGNRQFVPNVVTGIIMGLSFLFLFTYPWWAPILEEGIINAATEKPNQEDEDE
jgi:hypothetical protein